jgi:hypothetical protein
MIKNNINLTSILLPTLASVNNSVNLYYFYSCLNMFFYFFFLIFFNFFIIFGAGPSSAYMGWTKPSRPSPVTGPSQ